MNPSPEIENPQKIAVLVAWPYGNGPRHVGHGASLLPADVAARYFRSIGADVLMVSGTDEFGTPNMIAAENAGVDPQSFVDGTNEVIREDFLDLGMSFDWFTRTTSSEHIKNAQSIFVELATAGYIERGTMLGAFDSETGQSLPDRYVEGQCPSCGAHSRGDQCDSCSGMLDPSELIDPVSKITNNPVDFKETEHYFLMLDKLAPDVERWIEENQNLRPNAKSSSLAMARELRPRAITRDMYWGVPLPEGYDLEGDESKVLYVWFEAVIGYMSASMEWAKEVGRPEAWKEWWQNPDSTHYYAMGKDNVPFHTIVWPAMLSGVNYTRDEAEKLHLPDVIASTEYLTFNNGKLSSSRGNVVYVSDMLSLVGPDALRYYLISAGPETRDVSFSFHELTRRVNNELIANWGNLVNRSVSLVRKIHNSQIPEIEHTKLDSGSVELLDSIENAFSVVGELISAGKYSAALRYVMEVSSNVNKFIFDKEPWKTAKNDIAKAEEDMFAIMTAIKNINILFSPFLPHASQRVYEMLGGSGHLSSMPYSLEVDPSKNFSVVTGDYSEDQNRWSFSYFDPGSRIAENAERLFMPIDEEKLIEGFNMIALNRKLGKTAIQST